MSSLINAAVVPRQVDYTLHFHRGQIRISIPLCQSLDYRRIRHERTENIGMFVENIEQWHVAITLL